VLFLTPTEGIF